MKKILRTIISIALLGSLKNARASESVHEILGGTTGQLAFGATTQINGSGGYRYLVNSLFQLGIDVDYRYEKLPNAYYGQSNLLLMVGPTLNFEGPRGLLDAFFITLTGGISSVAAATGFSNTQFAFAGYFGKRIELTPQITFRPSVGVQKITGFDARFVVNPISFSVFFF